MLKNKKSKRGFSLMEIIISIATISIVSTFILQIFLVSSNANVRARNMDFASIMAQTAIEELKSMKYDQVSDAKAIADFLGYENAYNSGIGEDIALEFGFDEDWNEVGGMKDARFIMSLSLKLTPSGNEAKSVVTEFTVKAKTSTLTETGKVYLMVCSVIDTKAAEDKQTLASYQTNKYYTR